LPPADGPEPDLYSIALSPAGTVAAVAAADGRVYLLQGLAGTAAVTSVQAHEEVNAVAFSSDGRLLATAGQDGRLRWWTVGEAGLEQAGDAVLDAGPLYAAAFSPDGRSIATGGEDRIVRLVRPESPAEPVRLFEFQAPPGKSPEIESAVFVDEHRLAVSCGDLIALLDTETGRLVREFKRPYEGNRNSVVGSLSLSPDGRRLLGCGTDAKAHVWDVETGGIVLSLQQHPGWVQGCGFSPDGSQLATACRDGGVRVFDAATGRLEHRLLGHVGRVWSIVWEPGGTLLTAGADGTVRRWDATRGFAAAATEAISLAEGPLVDVMAGPATRPQAGGAAVTVYALALGGGIWEVDAQTRATRVLGEPREGRSWNIAIDPGRHRMAVCNLQSIPPQVFSLGPNSLAAARPTSVQLPAGTDPREAIAVWTPAGELVVRTLDGGLWWCPAELSAARRIATTDDVVHALVVAPAGPPRVAAYGDRAVIEPLPSSRSDRLAAGKPLVLPIAIETTAVAWSPDAAVVACGTRTGAIELFDAATGASLGALSPHERMIERILFSRFCP